MPASYFQTVEHNQHDISTVMKSLILCYHSSIQYQLRGPYTTNEHHRYHYE
jgi:hypothetical protein